MGSFFCQALKQHDNAACHTVKYRQCPLTYLNIKEIYHNESCFFLITSPFNYVYGRDG